MLRSVRPTEEKSPSPTSTDHSSAPGGTRDKRAAGGDRLDARGCGGVAVASVAGLQHSSVEMEAVRSRRSVTGAPVLDRNLAYLGEESMRMSKEMAWKRGTVPGRRRLAGVFSPWADMSHHPKSI